MVLLRLLTHILNSFEYFAVGIMSVGFPYGAVVKKPPASAREGREAGPVPGSGDPLWCSCLENPMDSMKREKDMTPEDNPPRSESVQYATGEE